MAIPLYTRESDTAPLVFPVLSGTLAYPSAIGAIVQLVIAGWDGKQSGVTIADPVRVRWLDTMGDVYYSRTPGELVAANSPYRGYIRIQLLDGSFVSAPQPPDYYLITVASNAF